MSTWHLEVYLELSQTLHFRYLRGLWKHLCHLWHKFSICICNQRKGEHMPINIWGFKVFFRWRLCICWIKEIFCLFINLWLNEFLQSEKMQKSYSVQNNPVKFVCLWYCVPPDILVQINNFFNLVLFSAVV